MIVGAAVVDGAAVVGRLVGAAVSVGLAEGAGTGATVGLGVSTGARVGLAVGDTKKGREIRLRGEGALTRA